MFNTNSQLKFITTMLKSSLCDYSDAHILDKRIISVTKTAATSATANNNDKVVFKNEAPFTDCISEIRYSQIDNAKDTDAVMPMYTLDFNGANNTDSFNFKVKITGRTGNKQC